jgi:hypothetical protein
MALPYGARFCYACGNQQQTAQTSLASRATIVSEQPQKESHKSKKGVIVWMLAGVVLLAVALVAIQYYQQSKSNLPSNAKTASTSLTPIPIQQNHDRALLDDNFVLPPGYIKTINFHVQGLGTVTGRFQARGGIDDAIRVIVTNADGYTNYRKRNAYRYWYDSNDVAVDNINATLGPGDYVLLVSNTGSLTNRTIQTNVKLSDYY